MAWGRTWFALSGGQPKIHWGPKSENEVKVLYTAFCAALKDGHYGVYDAVAMLIGHTDACQLETSQGLNIHNIALHSAGPSSSSIPSKWRSGVGEGNEFDDEISLLSVGYRAKRQDA